MEGMEGKRCVSFITCAAWIPKGVAKAVPDKVEIPKEELARIVKETKENIQELEELEEDDYEELENDAVEEGIMLNIDEEKENKEMKSSDGKKTEEKKKKKKKEGKGKEFESLYSLRDYDKENLDGMNQLLKLGLLTVHSSNDDDPYFTVKDDEGQDSEDEDDKILPTDNLIAVGHVEDDAAILEVYVYNELESSFYIHHDIILPAVPLCMEWLNYDPGDEHLRPGNMLAVGSMSPVIDVWDLDLVDCLEPAFTLGKKENRKKRSRGVGHKEPVLSLAWNKHFDHMLASGSVDETVILWDLQDARVGQCIKSFGEKVQSLRWHPKESQNLLTGACDKKVRLFDCRSSDTCKTWKLDGEIECVAWEADRKKPFTCVASTDQGTVFGIDVREEAPLWTLNAHEKACTAVSMSTKCHGLMLTVSSDESVRIWDIGSEKPKFVMLDTPQLGTIQCLASSPDSPFVFCLGGDNKKNNFKVWDVRESSCVRRNFYHRIASCGEEMDTEEVTERKFNKEMDEAGRVPNDASTSQNTRATSKPKFGKKKGGHLDRRRRRR
ncbi:periodic tryptophan protein 1 homolog [Panulirus ornatus]|uniref:periodic tryptophan protein 1 homolog n=1 Tax=Panulirus ornatus TaxID=150431 RepID=UPI003A8BDD2D